MATLDVSNGFMAVNGSIGGEVIVRNDGELYGDGTVGSVIVRDGGILIPGVASEVDFGVLNGTGNVTLTADSPYGVLILPDGTNTKAQVAGTAGYLMPLLLGDTAKYTTGSRDGRPPNVGKTRLKPKDKLLPNLDRKKTRFMVRRDLERVGIPYENEHGIADFHAAGRHTHITELLRNGATLPQAKELARHSDVKMTMKYTHIGLGDQAKALANLPSPKRAEPASGAAQSDEAALHMRCSFCSAEGHSVSPAVSDPADPKRRNPCGCKGFDADRRSMSEHVKMEAAGIEPAS